MKNSDRAWVRDTAKMLQAPRPRFVKKGDRRGTEHITRDDVEWPDARGVEPDAKVVRRELDRLFRPRRDGGPEAVNGSIFAKLQFAIERRAFPTRRTQARRERLAAIQHVAREHLGLNVSDADVGRLLLQHSTAHAIARFLLGRRLGVSPRRLRILRKS